LFKTKIHNLSIAPHQTQTVNSPLFLPSAYILCRQAIFPPEGAGGFIWIIFRDFNR